MKKKIICIVLIVIIILTVIIINNRTGYDEYSQKIKLAESEIELILKKHNIDFSEEQDGTLSDLYEKTYSKKFEDGSYLYVTLDGEYTFTNGGNGYIYVQYITTSGEIDLPLFVELSSLSSKVRLTEDECRNFIESDEKYYSKPPVDYIVYKSYNYDFFEKNMIFYNEKKDGEKELTFKSELF